MPARSTTKALTISVRSGSGLPIDGDLGDRRMFDDDALDVERADAIAGRGDDVVVAADEEEMPVGVLLHRVAGQYQSPRRLGVSACQ